MQRKFILGLAALLTARLAAAQGAPAPGTDVTEGRISETMQVTATRVPEEVLDVPASVTVIPGDELEARGAHDLASALALAAGVSIAPGGDGGPASAVPELMGLREFDAFLLVVDGVPWGGAFAPAISTLDLTNVDRIEVLRGAAPVLYGATSFVGVIHVIHRSPAATPREARVGGGSHGSWGAAVTAPLAKLGGLDQSLSAGYESRGFYDDRTSFDRAHALWTAAGDAGGGKLRLSADLTALDQEPASPHPREGKVLSPKIPLDSNHSPSDSRLDEDRIHLTGSFVRALAGGDWTTVAAYTHSRRKTTRGFLREEFDVPADESNADGYRQGFDGDDFFLDSHWSGKRGDALSIVAGVDLLAGRGEQQSDNFEYHVALDGAGAPSSRSLHIDESPGLEDRRFFTGAYAQALWKPSVRWLVDAGLRLNYTHEKQEGEVDEGGVEVKSEDSRTDTRFSGGVGASFLAWSAGDDALWLFADYKDAFKPAVVDFGPEAEGEILDPETARTIEGGVKGAHFDGRLTWQASTFRMDFSNLVVATSVDGLPALQNAGEERFTGWELEAHWRLDHDLLVDGAYAHHDARFRNYVQDFDGVPTQLDGKRLEMSPDYLAALGLTWNPARGFFGSARVEWVGERFLTKRNTALAGAYSTWSAGLGYRFERAEVRVDGENLSDRRDPVSESELGDAQYYRLPGRFVTASARFRF